MTSPSGEAAPPPRRVPRSIDAAALLLIVGGAAVYIYAGQRVREFAGGAMQYTALGGDAGGSNTQAVYRLEQLSNAGLGAIAAGVVLSIAAFAWVKLRRPPAPSHEQANHS